MRLLLAALAALATVAWFAPAAFGADSVYWTNDSGAIRFGNLSGGTASDLFTGLGGPTGITIDPGAGNIYWGDSANNVVQGANLDGSGTPSTLFTGETYGVAVDPAAGKIYWADFASGAIRVGSVSGGSASDLFTGEDQPTGIAIDPAAGKIYWTDYGSGKIRVGNLNGTGASTLFSSETQPEGVAIDPAGGRIYWSTQGGAIRDGAINGSGTASTLFSGENNPNGLAIDSATGKIYWADFGAAGKIRVGNLNGSGSPSDLFTGESYPYYVALLRSPAATAPPQVSGGSSAGSALSCSQGSWASDVLESFLYRAPRSFSYQWTYNGADIAGATSSTYTASSGGSYACRVTATNQAGSVSQTSASFAVMGAGTPPPTTTTTTTTTIPAPKLTGVSQSHRRWREGSALPHIASVRPPVGTRFRFTLNESARVRFVFKQRLPGRRVNGRCVAPTAKNRSEPKCTRLVTRGTLSFTDNAGAHKLRFQGRLSKRKKLPLGHYTLIITATNMAGQHVSAKLTFTIVR